MSDDGEIAFGVCHLAVEYLTRLTTVLHIIILGSETSESIQRTKITPLPRRLGSHYLLIFRIRSLDSFAIPLKYSPPVQLGCRSNHILLTVSSIPQQTGCGVHFGESIPHPQGPHQQ